MRIIDADALTEKLKKAIKSDKINRNSGVYCTASFPWWYDWLKSIVEKQPTVDAVEVVRCKDCKHWLKNVAGCTESIGRCEFANYFVGAAGFCTYGERREDG